MIICYKENCKFNNDQECTKNAVVMNANSECVYSLEAALEASEIEQIKREYVSALKIIKKQEELLKECEGYCPCMQKAKIMRALRGEFDE